MLLYYERNSDNLDNSFGTQFLFLPTSLLQYQCFFVGFFKKGCWKKDKTAATISKGNLGTR